MKLTLNQKIMLRVWYSYLLRVTFTRDTLRGFVLGSSAVLFFTLVSVPNVLRNFLSVEVGEVPTYIVHLFVRSFGQGEVVQLIALGVVVFSLLSFRLPKITLILRETTLRQG